MELETSTNAITMHTSTPLRLGDLGTGSASALRPGRALATAPECNYY